MEQNDIKSIVVEYQDGSKREITKGLIASFDKNEAEGTVSTIFNMLDIKGYEMEMVISAIASLAEQMGLL